MVNDYFLFSMCDLIETIDLSENAWKRGRASPRPADVERAWAELERIHRPLAGFCRACLRYNRPLPCCPRGLPLEAWWSKTRLLPGLGEIDLVADAVWTDTAILAWPALEDVLAREIDRRFARRRRIITHLDGPPEKREVHLCDSWRTSQYPVGRVLSCEIFELGADGPLQVLDQKGQTISRRTIERSGWGIHGGWVQIAPRGAGGGGAGGGKSKDEGGDEGTQTPAFDLEPPLSWTP